MNHPFADAKPFRRDPLAFLVDRANTATEPLVPLKLRFSPIYLLTDPEQIKPLLKMPEDVVDKGPLTRKFRTVTGDNIVVLSGPEHQRRRAVFHSIVGRNVNALAPMLAEETRRSIAELAEGQTFDAREFGISLALRMISVVAFGFRVLSAEEERIVMHSLRQIMVDLADVVFRSLPPTPWRHIAQRRRIEQSRQTMQDIVSRVRDRASDSMIALAYTELGLSDRQTADELLTFLIAGHDTTGAAGTWLFHALATMPGLADLIAAEAEAIRDSNGDLDIRKLSPTSATAMVVQEILRLYPSVYWFGRGVKQELQFAGRRLRPGTAIMVSPWMFQRSERYWAAPDEFRLDRDYKSKAYLPFGTGPRMCVGWSLGVLELQIMALEMASSMQLEFVGQPGAPRPWIHLAPPLMPMRARPRRSLPTRHAVSQPEAEDRTDPVSLAARSAHGCPYHTARTALEARP